MLNKISQLFQNKQAIAEAEFLKQHQLQFDNEQGVIYQGLILNAHLAERLNYLSNRRLSDFNDLSALYDHAMLINEKIDLEIAHQRYAKHLNNNESNLREFQAILKILNQYYREFKREKK